MSNPYALSDDMPVYVISVAANLSGMHPQTLRGYERVGLVIPRRTAGGGRRYSMRDILTLREIQRLSVPPKSWTIDRLAEFEALASEMIRTLSESAADIVVH